MKRWKKFLCIALASALTLGLCACNKDSGFGGSEQKAVSANAALAKEYVYRMDEFDFGAMMTGESTDYSVQKIAQSGGRIYVLLNTYQGDGTYLHKIVSVNEDGSDMKSFDLQTVLSQEEAPAESGSESTEGVGAGTATPVQPRTEESEVASEDAGIDTDMSLDEDFYATYVYENTSLSNFIISGDKLYANKTYYKDDYTDPENYISIRENYICCWDLEGNMLWETPVELLSDENAWYYLTALAVQPDGRVALLVSGEQNGKIFVDADGNVTELQPVDVLADYFTNSAYSAIMPDGRVLLSYYNSDWTELSVATYDFGTDALSEPYVVPATMTYNGLSNLDVDANGDLVYVNNQGVFKYHMGDAEPKQVMSFINSDMNVSYLDAFLWLNEEQFVGVYSIYNEVTYDRTLEGGIFTKVNPEDIPDKEVLVLGGNYIASDIKARVVNYNKSNDSYRIVLKDYSQYNTNEDYMAAYTQMNNDIIAGNMPDILVVDTYNMSLENYVSKGLLADIGELMANDEELSNIEYMDNVFSACKINDKLYEIIPAFTVSTYIGKTSVVGTRTKWTMEEAQDLMAKMPEEASLFGDMTRGGFFNTVMQMSGRDFVDISTGKCSFDSAEFISLMEFAKTLPEEITYDYTSEDWYLSYENQYRENRTILSSCYISDMSSLVYTINGSFGEPVSFVGMPTAGGQGSVIYTANTYAISAKSEYVDVAWDFMRYYLTDEYQDTLSWQLPIAKKQFDKLAQKGTKKPTYTDADGNEVEDEYYYWINNESVILEPFTQKQVYNISNFVSSVTTRAYNNDDIENIINEEMEAFYQGQKSAEEVAGLIQSRAQLYVNENR